jgi:hypothetical protein
MKKSTIIVIAVAFLGSSGYAAGLPESLTIKPYEEVSYNDNVFLSPKGFEDGSGICRTGLQLGYLRNRGDLSFDIKGKVEDVRYWKFSSLDYVGYDFTPSMKYDQGRWQLTLGGRFSYDLTPVDSTNIQQYETYSNGLNALWDYNWNEKAGVMLDGAWDQRKYVGMPGLDYNEFVAGIAPYYRFSPKTRAGLHLGGGARYYDQNIQQIDSQWLFVNAFVDYELTGKLDLRLEGGYVSHQYDSVNGASGQTWQGMNAKAALHYQASRKWAFDAALGTRPTDSYTVTAKVEPKLQILTEASLGASWSLTDKLTLSQRISYGFSDDKTLNLDNQQYRYNLDASYKLGRHGSVSVGYAYNAVDYSQVTGSDYKQSIFKAGFAWKF